MLGCWQNGVVHIFSKSTKHAKISIYMESRFVKLAFLVRWSVPKKDSRIRTALCSV